MRLFGHVCRAAEYAHGKGVVHRDLKPSNILVDAQGEAKLLDFGIAKLLEEREAEARALTRTGALLATPEYASPEQIRGEAVTPASDVYSLGVVLYELLTGHHPYRVSGRTPKEIERVVCTTDPQPLSEVVLRMEEVRHADGSAERITPEQVIRHYARFIELWKECDPELRPLRQEAERRLARLQSPSRG